MNGRPKDDYVNCAEHSNEKKLKISQHHVERDDRIPCARISVAEGRAIHTGTNRHVCSPPTLTPFATTIFSLIIFALLILLCKSADAYGCAHKDVPSKLCACCLWMFLWILMAPRIFICAYAAETHVIHM